VKRLFIVLTTVVLLAALSVGAVWLADHPGRVAIDWQGWRIDTSVGFLMLGLLAAIVLLVILLRVLRGVLLSPARLVGFLRERKREAGNLALLQGMAAIAIQDKREAQRQARIAREKLNDPARTAQLSAQAALLDGDRDTARQHFEAMSKQPKTSVVGLMGLMSLALEEGKHGDALEFAERAYRLRPDLQTVGAQLFDLQILARRWDDALKTVIEAVKKKTLPKETGQHRIATLNLLLSAEAEDDHRWPAALDHAKKAYDAAAGLVPAVVAYARHLRRQGKQRKAVNIVEQAWRLQPHPDLVTIYRDLAAPGTTALDQVKRIQKLVSPSASHTESRIALAEASLAADLWGEARGQLQGIEEDEPTARMCRLWASLEQSEHGDDAAAAAWFARAATAPQDEAWVCGTCGAVSPAWEAICGNCGAFDTIDWKVPPRVVRLEADHAPALIEEESAVTQPAEEAAESSDQPPARLAADAT